MNDGNRPADASPTPTLGTFPTAVVVPARGSRLGTRLWWIALACVAIAFALVATSIRGRGAEITIRFPEGHGLKAGDLLRYRGVAVGEVTSVRLKSDLRGVSVSVRLDAQATSLARRDSRFWIERPRVSLSRVSGLETVVGAKYLGVLPGPEDAPLLTDFEGLTTPPTLSEPEFIEVAIRFRQGHGLQVGDPVRHRGIVIGEVTSVDLNHELTEVAVRVRLSGEAHHLAREGTQFWIERPRVTVTEVRGLDTLIGGRFIAVHPGPEEAKLAEQFSGLDAAPVAELPAGALEIVLHAPQRWGVDAGVPVTFRGLTVGQVLSVGLSSDGTRIEARASVESRYRSLVRKNSVFWSTSGIDLNVGFTGLQLTADTLTSIARGGVAFATPANPDVSANTGQRFEFHKSARDEWLTWQPRIAAAEPHLPNGPRPEPQRGVARWEEKSFGFRRQRERFGWILLLANSQLLGPADVLLPSEPAIGPIMLELAGQQLRLNPDRAERRGSLATYQLDEVPAEFVAAWPAKRIRHTAEPEDCLIQIDAQTSPVPIAASSVTAEAGEWKLRTTNGLNPAWHGACVTASKDGQLLGVLVFDRGQGAVSLLQSGSTK